MFVFIGCTCLWSEMTTMPLRAAAAAPAVGARVADVAAIRCKWSNTICHASSRSGYMVLAPYFIDRRKLGEWYTGRFNFLKHWRHPFNARLPGKSSQFSKYPALMVIGRHAQRSGKMRGIVRLLGRSRDTYIKGGHPINCCLIVWLYQYNLCV